MKAEASAGYLGLLWWFVEPVLYLGVFYLLFAVMRIRGDGDFIPFLLVGLVVWKWFANSVSFGANSMERSSNLIQQIYVPKYVFPVVALLVNVIKFHIVLMMLLLFFYTYGVEVTVQWMQLPVIIVVQLLFTAGVVLFMASIAPFFPDLKQLIANGLTLMFFLSGVFFDIAKAPEHLQFYLNMNPMVVLVDSYRGLILDGTSLDWGSLMIVSVFSIVLICIGGFIMNYFDRLYPKVLL